MDNIERPIVRTFKRITVKDFTSTINKLKNSGEFHSFNYKFSNPTIVTNYLTESLKNIYYKKVPKNYYGEIKFDVEWELKINNKEN